MKNSNFKKALSILLIIFMTLSFAACVSSDTSTAENSSQEASQAQSNDSSEEASSSEAVTSEEASSEQSDESLAESSAEDSSSEASSESISDTTSEESSNTTSEESSKEDESSSEESSDVSVLNPYYGTDIKPAEGKVIAFTFDDGPSYTKSTEKILNKLEELGMKATFFVVGNRVSQGTAPMIQKMIDLGCDIGNHSYDHPNFNTMTVSQVMKQINDTNSRLDKYVGTKATLIRPPYGNITENQMASLNTPIICWDIDSLDWDLRDAQKIYDRTISKIHSGGIVLMHDIYDTTADAFCMLADKLVAEGYTLVTISELLGTEKLMCTTIKYGFKW